MCFLNEYTERTELQDTWHIALIQTVNRTVYIFRMSVLHITTLKYASYYAHAVFTMDITGLLIPTYNLICIMMINGGL